jgi:hypothetical protein
MLTHLSEEQVRVVKSVSTHNVICDSIAGSGKTTTILGIAGAYPEQKILLLTYNQRLKSETRMKALEMGFSNIEVHSYHSCAVKYYNNRCYTDDLLSDMLQNNPEPKPRSRFDKFNMLILDEAQDITPLYYKLVCYLIRDILDPAMKLCVLGDKYQSIFKYNNSDERYILLADKIFPAKRSWERLHLGTTYRLTDKMCSFINTCVLGYDRMHHNKVSQHPVRYIVCDTFGEHIKTQHGKRGQRINRVFEEVMYYLADCDYDHEDIFVIAPSVKSERSPVRILANMLSDKVKIPIFVPIDDNDKLDDDLVKGKMVFSTFHQVKGLERKVVIVMGFDDSYCKFYNKGYDTAACPNELYVAISRASERLSIIHHKGHDFLEFLNVDKLPDVCYFENVAGITTLKNQYGLTKAKTYGVKDLLRHISYDIINQALTFMSVKQIQEPQDVINISTRSIQGDLCESISEINGVAIPAYFSYIHTGQLPFKTDKCPKNGMLTPNRLLELSNEYCAYRSKYVFKTNQIKDYDWLTKEHLDACMERMHALFPNPDTVQMEVPVKTTNLGCIINGYIDAIDMHNKIVWEIKCQSELTKTDLLQLATYAYMLGDTHNTFRYRIVNILTNEICELDFKGKSLKGLVELLVWTKNNRLSTSMCDETFVSKNTTLAQSITTYVA